MVLLGCGHALLMHLLNMIILIFLVILKFPLENLVSHSLSVILLLHFLDDFMHSLFLILDDILYCS